MLRTKYFSFTLLLFLLVANIQAQNTPISLEGSWGVRLYVRGGEDLDGYVKPVSDGGRGYDYVAGAQEIINSYPTIGHVITNATNNAHAHLWTLRTNENVEAVMGFSGAVIDEEFVPSLANEQIIIDVITEFKKADKKVILYLNGMSPASRASADGALSWNLYVARYFSNNEHLALMNLWEGYIKRFEELGVDGYWLDAFGQYPGDDRDRDEVIQMIRNVDPNVLIAANADKDSFKDHNGEFLLVDSDGVEDANERDYAIIKMTAINPWSDMTAGHITPLGQGAPPNSWAYEEFTVPDIQASPTSSYDGSKQTLKHLFLPIRSTWSSERSDLMFGGEQAYRFVKNITDAGGAVTFSTTTNTDGTTMEDEEAVLKFVDQQLAANTAASTYFRPEGAFLVGELNPWYENEYITPTDNITLDRTRQGAITEDFPNPFKAGTYSSNTVTKFVRDGGRNSRIFFNLSNPITDLSDFKVSLEAFIDKESLINNDTLSSLDYRVRVYLHNTTLDTRVLKQISISSANTWESLEFDFSDEDNDPDGYDQMSIGFATGDSGGTTTYYFDNIKGSIIQEGPDAGTCAAITGNLTTSSIGDNNAYIYTPQPNGAINNQFRYRPMGSDTWILTDISINFFRYLSDLLAGTTYEFQVSQICEDGTYSEFSASTSFTTTGQAPGGESDSTTDTNDTDDNSGTDDTDDNTGTDNPTDVGGGGNDDPDVGTCAAITGNLTTSSIGDNNAFIYTPQPNGAINNQFRYRTIGSDTWITTDIANTHYRFLSDLLAGTSYEFQVSQICEDGTYSEFSASASFTTTGQAPVGVSEDSTDTNDTDDNSGTDDNTGTDDTNDNTGTDNPTDVGGGGNDDPDVGTCAAITGNLTTSSIGDNNAFIYTPQPNGAINNQFRYRTIGSDTWITTDIANTHYRFLSDLLAGTTYEFQVSQICEDGSYSEFSASASFTTTGQAPVGVSEDSTDTNDGNDGTTDTNDGNDTPTTGTCAAVTGDLTTSGIVDNNAFIYTPQPKGAINNQFRYRPLGSDTWITTDIANTHYRYLSDLLAGTTYEFQVSQICEDDSYSEFSASASFTTTGQVQSGNNNSDLATPIASTKFLQRSTSNKSVNITLSPNPVLSELALRLDQVSTDNATLRIYNISGKLLKELPLQQGTSKATIEVNNLQNGLYLLEYRTASFSKTTKFIKAGL